MNQQPRFDSRMLLIVGLIVIVGALFIIPRLNPGTANEPIPTSVPNNPVAPPLSGNGTSNTTNNSNIKLGTIVTATSVDRDGCPVNPTNTFRTAQQVYVVAQNSTIPAGTTVFVRLYLNNQPIEDAPQITADQDYNNSCVNFVFEPNTGAQFQSGQYEAEFIINGNASDSVRFQIQ